MRERLALDCVTRDATMVTMHVSFPARLARSEGLLSLFVAVRAQEWRGAGGWSSVSVYGCGCAAACEK